MHRPRAGFWCTRHVTLDGLSVQGGARAWVRGQSAEALGGMGLTAQSRGPGAAVAQRRLCPSALSQASSSLSASRPPICEMSSIRGQLSPVDGLWGLRTP